MDIPALQKALAGRDDPVEAAPLVGLLFALTGEAPQSPCGDPDSNAIRERIKEGVDVTQNALGELLADAFIDAQNWAFYFEARGIIEPAFKEWLDALDEVSLNGLEEDTFEWVDAYVANMTDAGVDSERLLTPLACAATPFLAMAAKAMSIKLRRTADPLGCAEDVREALGHRDLGAFDNVTATIDEGVQMASYDVAVALGRCRIFGVELDDDTDGTMPPQMALAAAMHMVSLLGRLAEDVKNMRARWDELEEDEEQISLCCDMCHSLMETWAAYVSLIEAHVDSMESGAPEAAELDKEIERVTDAFEPFAEGLQTPENLALLSVVCSTKLLRNWRAMLASEFRDPMPWWLDGTLESV